MPDDQREAERSVAPGAFTALLKELAAEPEPCVPDATGLPEGTTIGRFELVRELGRGAFGIVYEASDRDSQTAVAFKLVRPGKRRTGEAQLAREAEAVARLDHPNIVQLLEVGSSEHGPFLVFEFLRGQTLQQRLLQGSMSIAEAVRIASDVARGLAGAHADGVVHRDLKPANVMLCERAPAKILDFGMAHAFGCKRVNGGTPAYMAPEQWQDAPEDERTDVFALGVVLYRMLSGELPFSDRHDPWLEGPEPAPSLEIPASPALGALVARMLEKSPLKRPRDGSRALEALLQIEAEVAAAPSANDARRVRTRRAPSRVAVTTPAIALTGGEERRTADARAYEHYLSGEQFVARGTIDGLRRAVAAFESAIAISPGHAAALAGLAHALVWLWRLGADRVPGFHDVERRARTAAEAAVSAAPRHAGSLLARARVRLGDWDWEGARRDVDEALSLDPHARWGLRLRAALLSAAGRRAEAIEVTRQAIDADPRDAPAWASLGWYHLDGGDVRAARSALEQANRISPEFDSIAAMLLVSFLIEGRPAEAMDASRRCGDERFRLMAEGLVEHDLGHVREARVALDTLITRFGRELPYRVAELHAWRGEQDEAFAWLDRALAIRDFPLCDIRDDPLLRGLRRDPRYAALLARMNLPVE
ncbi:MAG: protein kinase domain-containing protein [Myxococcales bacterium]